MGKRKEFESGDLIDITQAASTTAARPEPEVIDLAEDSPHALSGSGRDKATKLNSSAAGHETSCSSAEDQRHNIMANATLIPELKLLTYNVWFEEDIALQERMCAIGGIIQEHDFPHFICFQEVTQRIYHLFQQSPWWHRYAASQPAAQPYFTALLYRKDTFTPAGSFQSHDFSNSAMGRGVLSVAGAVQGIKVRIATSHLESPCGHNKMFSKERVAQCKEGFAMLNGQDQTDVLWAGDMNWNTEDGDPPLPAGWEDAWSQQNPRDLGLTYDGKKNAMLGPYNRLRKRLDRVFFKAAKYNLVSIVMNTGNDSEQN
ncbi:hypothetical protein WJX79_000732 [Trebouxia sp. C0005]